VNGEDPTEKLHKVLARLGWGSRRACEEIVAAGRVEVNGVPVGVGARVDVRTDRVSVDGAPVGLAPDLRTVLLNKPRGVVSTASDTHGRPTVVDLVSSTVRLYPVGRLDLDTEGLILLTNDGELANAITHPSRGVEKEYVVEVSGGDPTRETLARLRRGVPLDDGDARCAEVGRIGDSVLRVVLTEGRKRQIRRMLETVGHPVVRLVRVRIGPLTDHRLAPGEHRDLTPEELRSLQRAVASPSAGTIKRRVRS